MRILAILIALTPLLAGAWEGDAAAVLRIEAELARANEAGNKGEIARFLSEAASVPWPLLSAPVEAQVLASRDQLVAEARLAWALDRALPLLGGALEAPQEVLEDVLGEVRHATEGLGPRGAGGELRKLESARDAYRLRDLGRAALRYAAVTRDSGLWSEALRERAWTLLVQGRPGEALGATVSLAAPYFPPEVHAEARLMTATVLLERCRFSEARSVIAALADVEIPSADPVLAQQLVLAGSLPEKSDWRRAWQEPLVARVRKAVVLLQPLDDTPFASRRAQLVSLGTRLLLEAFEVERETVREHKERALRVRYESLRGERLRHEAGLAERAPQPAELALLDDDEVAWDFDGRFWRDELGHYRFTVGDACGPAGRP